MLRRWCFLLQAMFYNELVAPERMRELKLEESTKQKEKAFSFASLKTKKSLVHFLFFALMKQTIKI